MYYVWVCGKFDSQYESQSEATLAAFEIFEMGYKTVKVLDDDGKCVYIENQETN